jgi:hypothetical protein
MKSGKKKGPLAKASGPSLGRKRPRRAAITRGVIAPQQYGAAAHSTQGFLLILPCDECITELRITKASHPKYTIYINALYWIYRLPRLQKLAKQPSINERIFLFKRPLASL